MKMIKFYSENQLSVKIITFYSAKCVYVLYLH